MMQEKIELLQEELAGLQLAAKIDIAATFRRSVVYAIN
jgi:hypothetical protein